MTTRDDLDRAIAEVAGALTRADAAGFGARVRARLERESARRRWPATFAWPWAPVTAAAAIAIIAVLASPAWRTPADHPRDVSRPVVANATVNSLGAGTGTETPEAPRDIAGGTRRARRTPTPVDVEWFVRAVPALTVAAPVTLRDVDINSIDPRGLDLPALVIEPLGPPDINK